MTGYLDVRMPRPLPVRAVYTTCPCCLSSFALGNVAAKDVQPLTAREILRLTAAAITDETWPARTLQQHMDVIGGWSLEREKAYLSVLYALGSDPDVWCKEPGRTAADVAALLLDAEENYHISEREHEMDKWAMIHRREHP